MQDSGRDHGHAAGSKRMGLLAERDRAIAGEEVVRFIVALVDVRRPLGDLHDMDVRHAAIAAGDDPLNVAEGAVDGRGFITVTDERQVSFLVTLQDLALGGKGLSMK